MRTDWGVWLSDPRVVARYEALCAPAAGHVWWTGAIMRSGHGRFWVGSTVDGRDVVVAAHRFGYGVAHGAGALESGRLVMHECDEPLCQDPRHLVVGTAADNRWAWMIRRHDLGSPLRDARGRYTRALVIRDTVRSGGDVAAVIAAGYPVADWDHPVLPGFDIVSPYATPRRGRV